MTPFQILTTVREWAFRPEQFEGDLEAIHGDSAWSYVRTEPPASYLEIVNQYMPTDLSSEENETESEKGTASMEMNVTRPRNVFEGPSYRIEIVQRKRIDWKD